MGGEIFGKALRSLELRNINTNLYNLNKLSIQQLNELYFKLTLITCVPFKISSEEDKEDYISRLNSYRYWTARRILLDKNVLAFIVHGDPDKVKETFSQLFKFGLYLPKDQYLKAINNYWDSIKYLNNITQDNVYKVVLDNLLFNPFGKGLNFEFLESHVKQKTNLDISLPPTTKINDVNNINKEINQWINQETSEIIINDKFVQIDHTINKKVNYEMFDLRSNILSMIRDACYNPSRFHETVKDNIVSLAFNWIKNPRFGNKTLKPNYADIIITKSNVKPPYNVIYNTRTIFGFIWYFYIGIDFRSSDNLKYINFSFKDNRHTNRFTLAIPKEWKIIEQNSDFLFILMPDVKINRLKTKTKNWLAFINK